MLWRQPKAGEPFTRFRYLSPMYRITLRGSCHLHLGVFLCWHNIYIFVLTLMG